MESSTPNRLSRRTFLGGAARAGILLPLATGGIAAVLSACADETGSNPDSTNAAPTGGERSLVGARYMTAFGFDPGFMETMIAQQQGFFEEEGVYVEVLGGSGTATALQGVLGGSTHFSRANAINTMVAIANENAPIVNIATVRQRGQFELASLAESPINSPDEIRPGMKIGIVSPGGSTENLIDILLIQRGIELTQVSKPIVGTGPAGFEIARKGEVDAWVVVDTDRLAIQREAGEDALVHFSLYDHVTLPSDSFNASLELVQSEDDRAVRFLAGVLRAIEWASDEANWEAAVEAVAFYNPDTDRESVLAQMPLIVDDWLASGPEGVLELQQDVWEEGQANLEAAGILEQTVELDKLIYPEFLKEAKRRIA